MNEKKDLSKITSTEELVKSIKEDMYPSNSNKARLSSTTEKKEVVEKKVEKVIKGHAVAKKRGFFKKASELLVGEDAGSVKSYILYDVLIPALKSTLSEMVSSGVEMLLFGEAKRGNRTQRDKGKSYVSYSSYYKNDRNDNRRDTASTNRARHTFDDIILETRGEAEEVLSCLVDLVEDYGIASVADLYNLVGIPGNYTDNKWGWENLSSSSVARVKTGYLINLPRAVEID